MKLTISEIQERVNQTDSSLSGYDVMAARWEKMWRLDPGFAYKDAATAVKVAGREQVTTPEPYNIVNLAMRLIATQPDITIPPRGETDEDNKASEKIEKWLGGMWQRAGQQAARNLVADATFYALVRGACIFEVKWVKDILPEKLRKTHFPISIRVLDPLNVGVQRGPIYTEHAYHKYTTTVSAAKQSYPKLKLWKKKTEKRDEEAKRGDEVIITDFWYTDSEGGVWNAILVEDEFGKEPTYEEKYPYVPIIEGFGDSAPGSDQAYRRMSILHPIDGLWQYKCRMTSNLGTGVLWYTFPHVAVIKPQDGSDVPDTLEIRPGATDVFPYGTEIKITAPQVNMPALQAMMGQIDAAIQQATFPGIMYGDSGAMQAGFGVSMLTSSAAARIKGVIEYLQMAIQAVNELALALVEGYAGDEGVELYAYNDTEKRAYTSRLTKPEIHGYYRNIVSLENHIPQDINAKDMLLMQLQKAGALSSRTLRDNLSSLSVPADEDSRIWAERAELVPSIQARIQVTHLAQLYPDSFEELVKGTELEQAAIALKLIEPPPPPPPPMGVPSGPGMGPMGGPPPGMPPMGPPPPPMMPPGPPMMPPGPPMEPPPPDMSMQPPMELIPPMGGGIPPEMQNMFGPEDLGMPRQGAELPFQQAMGQEIPPAELARLLGGMPSGD